MARNHSVPTVPSRVQKAILARVKGQDWQCLRAPLKTEFLLGRRFISAEDMVRTAFNTGNNMIHIQNPMSILSSALQSSILAVAHLGPKATNPVRTWNKTHRKPKYSM